VLRGPKGVFLLFSCRQALCRLSAPRKYLRTLQIVTFW
jgi:hypothetical protein